MARSARLESGFQDRLIVKLCPPLSRDMITKGRSNLVFIIVDPVILTRAEKGVLAFKV